MGKENCFKKLIDVIISGHCLKCYQCLSARGWDHCEKKKQTCPLGTDTCAKFHQELSAWGGSLSGKGCVPQAMCKDILQQKDVCGNNNCVMNCCTKDLCNGARQPLVSAMVLFTCSLLVIFN